MKTYISKTYISCDLTFNLDKSEIHNFHTKKSTLFAKSAFFLFSVARKNNILILWLLSRMKLFPSVKLHSSRTRRIHVANRENLNIGWAVPVEHLLTLGRANSLGRNAFGNAAYFVSFKRMTQCHMCWRHAQQHSVHAPMLEQTRSRHLIKH